MVDPRTMVEPASQRFTTLHLGVSGRSPHSEPRRNVICLEAVEMYVGHLPAPGELASLSSYLSDSNIRSLILCNLGLLAGSLLSFINILALFIVQRTSKRWVWASWTIAKWPPLQAHLRLEQTQLLVCEPTSAPEVTVTDGILLYRRSSDRYVGYEARRRHRSSTPAVRQPE